MTKADGIEAGLRIAKLSIEIIRQVKILEESLKADKGVCLEALKRILDDVYEGKHKDESYGQE